MISKGQNQKLRILLVEDDPSMGYLLQDSLEMAGYQVDLFSDGQSALNAYLTNSYNLGVFDVMLPLKDGFSLAMEIRRLNLELPIIFLTARSMKEDRIKGFKLGADDYVTKPFSMEEFILRIEAILKRVYAIASQADKQSTYNFGTCILDIDNQMLTVGDQIYDLTQKEAGLLKIFCDSPNKLIAREIIQKAIWEDDGYFVGRSLDVFISRLRKMLKDDHKVKIVNVHGSGYKLDIAG
ncbi:response regulator transcription factor [Rhodocytophaga aerolata]|uniref:Response regulator transcription factor n=1 Tax=Rhodocytophaga aerolata TaxID=455078 RepID=A0ABT8RDV6_9BACT|nr:response regulator transcription factor [Rhodocytophaga aerolata]MDO1450290.1 response regulator transcription factor [Rhodocytophaga aerolata]